MKNTLLYILFVFSIVLLVLPIELKAYNINNQREFNNLRQMVEDTLSHSDSCIITIKPGVYYYNDSNNLKWKNKNWGNKTIRIRGNSDVTLISEISTYFDSASWVNGSIIFQNGNRNTPREYDRWSNLRLATDTCKLGLHTSNMVYFSVGINDRAIPNTPKYVQFTEWYRSHVYEYRSVINNRLTFRYPSSTYSSFFGAREVYYPNFDYYHSTGRITPRYRFLSNPSVVNRTDTVFYCTSGSFVNIKDSQLNSLEISGVRFLCNKKSKEEELIRLWNNSITRNVLIENCSFEAIRSEVIYLKLTNDVTVQNCTFNDCYESCVVSLNGSERTKVLNNSFRGCGKGFFQNFCIICRGEDFVVERNSIQQFTYSAIGVGNDLESHPLYPVTGRVSNNYIDNSGYEEPESAILQHTLMDAGAIYIWHWNNAVTINNNTICNYGGVHTYRGIFGDQGTRNVTITGNIIDNIKDNIWNEHQHSISIPWYEYLHDSIPDHNSGNLCYDNYIYPSTATINIPIPEDCHCNIIGVDNQSEFDDLNNQLHQAFLLCDTLQNIVIRLSPGTYRYSNNHIQLNDLNVAASIRIEGNGAVLLPNTISRNDILSYNTTEEKKIWLRQNYYASGQLPASNWSDLAYALDTVVYAGYSNLSFLQTNQFGLTKNANQCNGWYIQITQWYKSQVFPVERIVNGRVFFHDTSSENINFDYPHSGGRLFPRYRLFETQANQEYANASTLISIVNSKLVKFQLQDISVIGNDGASPLVFLNSAQTNEILFENCTFTNIHGMVIHCENTPDLIVQDCTFLNCFADGIVSYNGSLRTKVQNCSFSNIGGNLGQYYAIICRGQDFIIENNQITDFCFGAIGAGVWYNHDKLFNNNGAIRNNDICMTDSFVDAAESNTLMGGSAIYLWTKNDGISITDNRISNIKGVRSYRGILGEGGPNNLLIANNSLMNMHEDVLGETIYGIDVPWDSSKDAIYPLHNTRNVQYGNRYDNELLDSSEDCPILNIYGKIRFHAVNPNSYNMEMNNLIEGFIDYEDSDNQEEVADDNSVTTYYNIYGSPISKPTNSLWLSRKNQKNTLNSTYIQSK